MFKHKERDISLNYLVISFVILKAETSTKPTNTFWPLAVTALFNDSHVHTELYQPPDVSCRESRHSCRTKSQFGWIWLCLTSRWTRCCLTLSKNIFYFSIQDLWHCSTLQVRHNVFVLESLKYSIIMMPANACKHISKVLFVIYI